MATATLLQLRTSAQNRADMVGSTLVSTSLWNEWINEELAELYERLSNAGDASTDRYTSTTLLTISAGQSSTALPNNFYTARKVEYVDGTDYLPLARTTLGEATEVRSVWQGRWSQRSYMIVGGMLHVRPVDVAPGTYRLWFVPEFAPLSADGDSVVMPHSWFRRAVLGAAIKALKKESSLEDAAALMQERAELTAHLDVVAESRDASGPSHVSETWDAWA